LSPTYGPGSLFFKTCCKYIPVSSKPASLLATVLKKETLAPLVTCMNETADFVLAEAALQFADAVEQFQRQRCTRQVDAQVPL